MFSMPESMHSSTAYWIRGLSTTGSISFGIAFVAGRNRVPSPATGRTALRTRFGFGFDFIVSLSLFVAANVGRACPLVDSFLFHLTQGRRGAKAMESCM